MTVVSDVTSNSPEQKRILLVFVFQNYLKLDKTGKTVECF